MRETAERASSAQVSVCPAAAEAVLRLAWLSPSAASLAALGRPPTATTWSAIRHDPGAVLLVVRRSDIAWPGRKSSAPPLPFHSTALQQPELIDDALRWLDQPAFVDWSQPAVRPVYDACLACARLARRLAVRNGRCDPEAAWACGLLAPLGWLAMCGIDPPGVAACLADPALSSDPIETQRRHWGIDQHAVARRLARRWRLPRWMAAVIEHLGLPIGLAKSFGADPLLFPLTRLALDTARRRGFDPGLTDGCFAADDRTAVLGDSGTVDELVDCGLDDESAICNPQSAINEEPPAWEGPRRVPLLRDLLAAAAENRRLHGRLLHHHLEEEIDALHRHVEEQVRSEAARLQASKLAALAEFAAGAGHEINNPLAVISGQAQYLLNHQGDALADDEDTAGKALHAIIAQTRRIHGILRDLMQFARPAPASPGWFDLPTLLGEVAAGLGELAAARHVRIEVVTEPDRLPVHADAGQVRVALSCLLRNALEAAPPEGWARLVLKQPAGAEQIDVAVEDSGPGPEPAHRPFLFDPFFSGRTAGRGRGLGLPIAWRLIRQQGGDVRLDTACPAGPTRFVLTLPLKTPDSDGAIPPVLPLPYAVANGRQAS